MALEMRVTAITRSGNRYDNRYAIFATIRAGKIVKMNEYLDTALATAALS